MASFFSNALICANISLNLPYGGLEKAYRDSCWYVKKMLLVQSDLPRKAGVRLDVMNIKDQD